MTVATMELAPGTARRLAAALVAADATEAVTSDE